MTPLHGAIAFVEVQQIAVIVRENLDFEMARTRQIFFQKDAGVAESRFCFALSFFETLVEFRLAAHYAHAAAAAAHGSFHDDRVTDRSREFTRFSWRADRFFRSRKNRHAGRIREASCGGLVSKEFEQFRRRADEYDAGLFAGTRKCGILGQEAVARMNGVNALLLGQCDDAGDIEVRHHRAFARADLICLVGLESVQSEAVFLRIDADGAQAELIRGTENPYGDFTAIGSEQFSNGFVLLHPWADK